MRSRLAQRLQALQREAYAITPLGIALALRLTPPEILVEARARAETEIARGKPVSRFGAALVIVIWVALAIALTLAATQLAARV